MFQFVRLSMSIDPTPTLFGTMRKPLVLLLCCILAACSAVRAPFDYVPPSMPSMTAANEGVRKAAAEAKLIDAVEISDMRQTDHGPGRFFLCMRGVESKYRRVRTYAVFFENDDYKGLRMSVILDDCERQEYRPFP
jgi:hypothetical protein